MSAQFEAKNEPALISAAGVCRTWGLAFGIEGRALLISGAGAELIGPDRNVIPGVR